MGMRGIIDRFSPLPLLIFFLPLRGVLAISYLVSAQCSPPAVTSSSPSHFHSPRNPGFIVPPDLGLPNSHLVFIFYFLPPPSLCLFLSSPLVFIVLPPELPASPYCISLFLLILNALFSCSYLPCITIGIQYVSYLASLS